MIRTPNMAHALDAGLRFSFNRASLARASDTTSEVNRATSLGTKTPMIIHKTITSLFLVACVCVIGCSSVPPYPRGSASVGPNPVAGWAGCQSQDFGTLDKAIQDDYRDYVSSLTSNELMWMGPRGLSEDGSGQHAITIHVAWWGTDWAHVLVYDKDNKRIRTVRYVAGHYRC
jgi:hypothetical protein